MSTAHFKFRELALSNGWEVEETAGEAVDYKMTWGKPMIDGLGDETVNYGVIVVDRNTAEKGEEVWVAIRGEDGKGSYLYSEAHLLAFDMGDRFLVVDRNKLREWIEENVTKEYVTLAHQALMKVYKKGQAMSTLLKAYHLTALADGEMKYGR